MPTEHLASFDLQQLKLACLEGLSKQGRTFFVYNQIVDCLIAEIFGGRAQGFRDLVRVQWVKSDHVIGAAEDSDTRKIMTVLWGLISDGVLYPRYKTKDGVNAPIDSCYGITEYGQRLLGSLGSHPSSPGFIAYIRGQAPEMSDDVVACLEDASECLRRGVLRAATVMIGLTSEITLRVTLEGLHHLGGPEPKSKAVAQVGQLTTAIGAWTHAEEKHRLTQALSGLETIRVERNKAAHPSGVVLNRDHIESLLILAANKILVFWQIPIRNAITGGFILS